MVDRQADTVNNFIWLLMVSTNKSLDTMTKNIQELKDSIQFTQRDMDDIETKVSESSSCHSDLGKDVNTVCQGLVTPDAKAEYLNNQSRGNNFIFDGIKKSAQESWEDSEGKICKLISEGLGFDAKAIAIERTHHLGKPDPNGKRNHPVVV